MSKTCAECSRHNCTNICTSTRYGCDGYCKDREAHRNCYRARCKQFDMDEFFVLDDDFKFKEN